MIILVLELYFLKIFLDFYNWCNLLFEFMLELYFLGFIWIFITKLYFELWLCFEFEQLAYEIIIVG